MDIICFNCHQQVEPSAAFCGNCGHKLEAANSKPASVVAAVYVNQASDGSASALPHAVLDASGHAVPAYALPVRQTFKETPTIIALVLGVLGIASSLILPIVGLLFGVVSLVLSTSSRFESKKAENTVSVAVGSLALLLSVIMCIVYVNSNKQRAATPSVSGTTQSAPAAAGVTSAATACYSAGFTTNLTIIVDNQSCEMRAFNGASFESSGNVYLVIANSVPNLSVVSFTAFSKTAIEKDFATNLPKYAISNERTGSFAGSPAYYVTGSNGDVSITEALVMHQTAQGSNVFTLLHGINGGAADLSELEAAWVWGGNS